VPGVAGGMAAGGWVVVPGGPSAGSGQTGHMMPAVAEQPRREPLIPTGGRLTRGLARGLPQSEVTSPYVL